MMLKAVFFDLDGTLLPMNEEKFTKAYFYLLCGKMQAYGYQKDHLVDTIWKGTKRMYQNDGLKTNEEVFWETFVEEYGKGKLKDKKIFDEFYYNEFYQTVALCKENKLARDIVEYAKKKTGRVVLSTNPIFPCRGTLTRMSFVNLKEADFDYITSYENSSYTKPNPAYFNVLLEQFNLKPSEVILFGNNDIEDYECAKQAGIDCYLVGKYTILHPDRHINCPIISMDEVISYINLEYEKRK